MMKYLRKYTLRTFIFVALLGWGGLPRCGYAQETSMLSSGRMIGSGGSGAPEQQRLAARVPDSVYALQAGASTFKPKRFWIGMGAFAAADAAVMYGLDKLWYSEEGKSSFQFYSGRMHDLYGEEYDDGFLDDWHNYVQQDKLGHAVVAWHMARAFGAYGRWSGLSDEQAGLFGGIMSSFFQSQIEVFDGFSRAYGFSRTDVLANLFGSTMGGLQVAYPELTWFTVKYSYHRSPYYDEGTNWVGNALKDYDGISYWFVVRPERLLGSSAARRWPDWLALSVGYSGDGLAHSISGRTENGGFDGPVHRRQLYVGLDFDVLTAFDWPQPLKAVAGFFSFVRLPAPALQLGPDLRWYWIFY